MGTRAEIYVMGLRNPFRMTVDRRSGTLMWGDYGPDAGRDDPARGPMGLVEWNAVSTTGGAHNSGWPYCTGDNLKPYNNWNFVTSTPREFFNCGAIKNTSRNNTGLVDLPPARPATVWYGDRNCRTLAPADCDNPKYPELTSFAENIEQAPMAGPVYRHDPANPSTTKFPAYWDGKAFFGEYSQDYIAAFTLTKPNGPITKIENFFPNLELGSRGYALWDGPIDLEFGPDGSLYVLNYITRNLVRVDYSPGNRRPRATIAVDRSSGGAAPLAVAFDAGGSTDPDGDALTYEWDFDGNGTWDATGDQGQLQLHHQRPVQRPATGDRSFRQGRCELEGDLGRQHRADGDAAHPARRRLHRLGPRLGVPDPGLRPRGHGRDHLQPRALDDLPRPRLARASVHDGRRLQGRRADLPRRRRAR